MSITFRGRVSGILLFVSMALPVACGPADDGGDEGSGGDNAPERDFRIEQKPRPPGKPPRPCRVDCVREYTWAADGVYDFDGFTTFEANLVDPAALSLAIPEVVAGDELRVEASGLAYAEHQEAGVNCVLQAHVREGGVFGEEVELSAGGLLTFALDTLDPEQSVGLAGHHDATRTGGARVRILGRLSRPDRFCGLTGHVELRVTHLRRTVR